MPQPFGDKSSLKRAWSGSRDQLFIFHLTKYLRNG